MTVTYAFGVVSRPQSNIHTMTWNTSCRFDPPLSVGRQVLVAARRRELAVICLYALPSADALRPPRPRKAQTMNIKTSALPLFDTAALRKTAAGGDSRDAKPALFLERVST